MSLADRLNGGSAVLGGGSGFSCRHYEREPGQKRCRHYLPGGACARPEELMCVEWLRANGHPTPEQRVGTSASEPGEQPVGTSATPAPTAPTPSADPMQMTLFGAPVPLPTPAPRPLPRTAATALPSTDEPQDPQPVRGLTAEDIASFKALGVEVCVSSEALGLIWLVPEYTGKDRKEITLEHAATLCRVLDAFPGSTVVAFDPVPNRNEESPA